MTTAAIAANPLGVLVAFGGGILSFLSPCVLPLVPGYVSMVSGLSAAELESSSGASGSGPSLRPLLRGVGLFVAGFTVVFVALGAAASGLGHLLGSHKAELTTASGALIVALGAVMLAAALPSRLMAVMGSGPMGTVTSRIFGERRFNVRATSLGVWAAPVMGMAFAFAWTPCIGPVLGAVLGLATTKSTLGGGVVLLFAYSLGLGVPFVVTGVAFGRLTALYGRARRGLWMVHVVAGGVLVAFGVILIAGKLGWMSSELTALLDHIGLRRFASS